MNGIAKIASTLTARRLLEHAPTTVLPTAHIAEKVSTLLLASHCCPRCILRFLGVRDRKVHASFLGLTKEWVRSEIVSKSEEVEGAVDVVESAGNEEEESNVTTVQPVKKLKAESPDGTIVEVTAQTPLETASRSGPNASLVNSISDSITPSSAARVRERTCVACLGLLHTDHHLLAQNGYDLFQRENYILAASNRTFVLSMRLPPQLAIRQRSVQLYLEHELGSEAMEDIGAGIEVKEVLKYLICDAFEEASSIPFDPTSPFSLSVHYDHPRTERDYMFMTGIPEAEFKIKKTRQKGRMVIHGASCEKITKAVDKLSYEHFAEAQMCPPPIVTAPPKLMELSLQHTPIFVAGRYLKLQRHISNSPWIIGGKRMTEHSVEDLVAEKVDAFFRSDGHRFYSSGREDADVLMLGRGRPYYLELLNPRRVEATAAEMKELQDAINEAADGQVQARDLQIVSKDETKILKDAADTKSKSYTTLVKLSSPVAPEKLEELSKIRDLAVKQRNPTRVPRRADLIRDKIIESLRVYPSAPTTAASPGEPTDEVRVDVTTSAGTYVKEFVHSDEGRTTPSLKELLGVDWAKVLELDVLEVHLDWPKTVQVPKQEE